jgi:hypothetical protein
MSKYTFGINSAKKFFCEKVLPDYEAFKNDSLSPNAAINAAMSSWHLIDWIFNDHSLGISFNRIEELRSVLMPRCASLALMHDLANGGKHLNLSRPKEDIVDTQVHHGSFDDSFDSSFDVSGLIIELSDGSKLDFETELDLVISFWKDYLTVDLGITL